MEISRIRKNIFIFSDSASSFLRLKNLIVQSAVPATNKMIPKMIV